MAICALHVREEPKRLAGIVYLKDIRHINKEQWRTVMLVEFLEFEPTVASPDELLDDVTGRMADGNVTAVPVIDKAPGELVGSKISNDVMASAAGERKADMN